MQEGTRVDGYRVVRKLGQGAMGAVFEAVHEGDGRRAAIKVLLSQFTSDPEIVARFFNEARAANVIDHPGVVKVFGTGKTADGSSYLAMEYLEGESLKDRLKGSGGRLRVNLLEIGGQIAAALCAAHERKIIHRDLKPDNIMILQDETAPGGERVKILDFGIAKLLDMDDVGVQTAAGVAMGTPTYMSPEQFTGAGEVTAKADVYSLGVILYHFVAGRPPFLAKGPGELLQQHARGIVLPLRQLEPSVDEGLASLVQRMLSKAPAERPTMQEVRDALLAMAGGASLPLPAPRAEAPREALPRESLPRQALPPLPRPPQLSDEPVEGTMLVRPGMGAGAGPAGPRRRTLLLAGLIVVLLLGGAAAALRRIVLGPGPALEGPPGARGGAPKEAPGPAPRGAQPAANGEPDRGAPADGAPAATKEPAPAVEAPAATKEPAPAAEAPGGGEAPAVQAPPPEEPTAPPRPSRRHRRRH